eukprot:s1010_g20.t1
MAPIIIFHKNILKLLPLIGISNILRQNHKPRCGDHVGRMGNIQWGPVMNGHKDGHRTGIWVQNPKAVHWRNLGWLRMATYGYL